MIRQKVDPRNPKGSCQRLLEEFASKLNGNRGRVWVGSSQMKEAFEGTREKLRDRLKEGLVFKREVGDISVEICPASLLSAFYPRPRD